MAEVAVAVAMQGKKSRLDRLQIHFPVYGTAPCSSTASILLDSLPSSPRTEGGMRDCVACWRHCVTAVLTRPHPHIHRVEGAYTSPAFLLSDLSRWSLPYINPRPRDVRGFGQNSGGRRSAQYQTADRLSPSRPPFPHRRPNTLSRFPKPPLQEHLPIRDPRPETDLSIGQGVDDEDVDEAHEERQSRKSKLAIRPTGRDGKAIQQELVWLRDPLKLSDRVESLLDKQQFQKALLLVREAGREMETVPCWNRLINYEMNNGGVNTAFKLYQEMKKRAQKPDGRTFTILFNGLRRGQPGNKANLTKALSLYTSMSAPNSPVRPSIIHTNSVIEVCGRLGDTDAMWGIAGDMPTRGPGAPDKRTWTTLFNATRENVSHRQSDETLAEWGERIAKAVIEARRMWQAFVVRWSRGDVVLDERLVCAVGRMLLMGNRPRDWDDVLSLVEQTMGIRRLTTKLSEKDGKKVIPLRDPRTSRVSTHTLTPRPPQGLELDNVGPLPEIGAGQYGGALLEATGNSSTPQRQPLEIENPGAEFKPLDTLPSPAPEVSADSEAQYPAGGRYRAPYRATRQQEVTSYTLPSSNTLSLIMETCHKLGIPKAASAYWDILTTDLSIKPDMENCYQYLRVIRHARTSRLAVELLRDMRAIHDLSPGKKGYWIAISCCSRDWGDGDGVGAVEHATNVVSMYVDDVQTWRAGWEATRMRAQMREHEIKRRMGMDEGEEGVLDFKILLDYMEIAQGRGKGRSVIDALQRIHGWWDLVELSARHAIEHRAFSESSFERSNAESDRKTTGRQRIAGPSFSTNGDTPEDQFLRRVAGSAHRRIEDLTTRWGKLSDEHVAEADKAQIIKWLVQLRNKANPLILLSNPRHREQGHEDEHPTEAEPVRERPGNKDGRRIPNRIDRRPSGRDGLRSSGRERSFTARGREAGARRRPQGDVPAARISGFRPNASSVDSRPFPPGAGTIEEQAGASEETQGSAPTTNPAPSINPSPTSTPSARVLLMGGRAAPDARKRETKHESKGTAIAPKTEVASEAPVDNELAAQVKRKRGRPRKVKVEMDGQNGKLQGEQEEVLVAAAA